MRIAALLLAGMLVAAAGAQTIYHTTPDWISTDSAYATGAALVDLNRDGWPDLVVSNGNDMNQEHVAVYYNHGNGTFSLTPDWQSADSVYNGHLDVADVDGDGWPDVAVATLGEFNTTGPIARVYLNHNGTLSSTPAWSANIQGNAFGVAFGDMNNDGRPDLAVGTGWSYSPQHFYPNYVYLNVGGTLAATPSWTSDDTYHYMGVLWVDADDDGWLDLVGVASLSQTRLYRNLGGALETTASWSTTDAGTHDSIMATAGEVNGDGYRDLFVTDNTQLGGTGRFRQYNGLPAGLFHTTPDWYFFNSSDQYGSAVALADVNADGHLDLATGAWWSRSRIFLNTGTGFGATSSWRSDVSSVVEKIVFGDLRKRGLRTVVEQFPSGTPAPHVFYLAHQPIQTIRAVRRNGVELSPAEYTFSREHGWVTVGPSVGDVEVEYEYSGRLDMAITNWDDTIGNYVYYNQLPKPGDLNCDGVVDFGDIDPFVLALTSQSAYEAQYPNCRWLNGDCDFNGTVDFADIDPFVTLLSG